MCFFCLKRILIKPFILYTFYKSLATAEHLWHNLIELLGVIGGMHELGHRSIDCRKFPFSSLSFLVFLDINTDKVFNKFSSQ